MTKSEKEAQDETAKKDESSGESPKVTSKKRKGRTADAEEEAKVETAQSEEDKQKAKKSKTGDGEDSPQEEKAEEKEGVTEKEAEGAEKQAEANPAEQPAGGVNNAAIAAALGNPLLAAGMPLAAVAGLSDSPNANFNPFLMAQQGQFAFGGPGMQSLGGNAGDQNRLLQGLVANRPGNSQQQQGQGQEAANGSGGGQAFPPGFPAAMQQMYPPGVGMDAMQMQMMMGLGGNPFLRPGVMGGRIEDVPLSSLAGGLYRTPSVPLALPCDEEHLSEYQILVRQQLELFEAEQEDVDSNTQGRKKQVTLGQVGIRCRHCAGLTLRQRGKGSVYYPTKLNGIYQAAQNMAASHLSDACQCIDDRMKVTLMNLRQRRDTASGGKQYWADGAKAIGLYETEDGLRLSRQGQPQQQQPAQQQQPPQQQQQV